MKLDNGLKIKYDEDAINELNNIYIYVKEQFKEPKIAEKLINTIKQKIKLINYFPFAYKLIKKSKNFEYRKFIIKNYIIIYKINLKEKEVNILHIYNEKQKIKNKEKQVYEQNS